jgi:hypothetical protein
LRRIRFYSQKSTRCARAHKQAALELTTFGIKDVQKQVPVLKCDYDPALAKLTEMCEQLDLAVHVEANLDVSMYPAGKRFLHYAGWMEDSWMKGWACTAKDFTTDGDTAQIKTGSSGGSGNLYRVSTLAVDSLVFKKLLLELKGSDVDTKYTVKVVTADDTQYTVQAETAAPTDYTVKQWDLTSIITGANKTVKNIHLLISKTGSQGTLYFKWLGFFPATPPYEKIVLDAAQNVKAGVFIREPKKARNMIIVKGDKHVYNVPYNSDEWTKEPAPTMIEEDDETFWGYYAHSSGSISEPTVSADTSVKLFGSQSTKFVVGAGSYAFWLSSHDYVTFQDWSAKRYAFLYWYGANTGGTLKFGWETSSGNGMDWEFVDNFTGWKLLIFDLSTPTNSYGSPNRAQIRYVSVGSVTANLSGTWRLDKAILSVGRYCWGSKFFTLTNDMDSKTGIYSLKAVKQSGVASNFLRKSSGLIVQDPFDSLDLGKYDKGWSDVGDGDSYVSGGELVNKIKRTGTWDDGYHRWIVTEDKKSLAGKLVETKIKNNVSATASNMIIFSPLKMSPDSALDPLSDIINLGVKCEKESANKSWQVWERPQPWPELPVTHYNSGGSASNPDTMVAKIVFTATNLKVYLDNNLVCNVARVTDFVDAYVYLSGFTHETDYQYPKCDDFKIYSGLKIFVEGLSQGWKVELWSGTYASPGSKQAEATVPAGSSVAELDVLSLTFPFTGFFKVFDDLGSEDHHSPDYSDVWGGDIYQAQQTTSVTERMVYFPHSKDLKINALALKR